MFRVLILAGLSLVGCAALGGAAGEALQSPEVQAVARTMADTFTASFGLPGLGAGVIALMNIVGSALSWKES